jgi:hypothetical protein
MKVSDRKKKKAAGIMAGAAPAAAEHEIDTVKMRRTAFGLV